MALTGTPAELQASQVSNNFENQAVRSTFEIIDRANSPLTMDVNHSKGLFSHLYCRIGDSA